MSDNKDEKKTTKNFISLTKSEFIYLLERMDRMDEKFDKRIDRLEEKINNK